MATNGNQWQLMATNWTKSNKVIPRGFGFMCNVGLFSRVFFFNVYMQISVWHFFYHDCGPITDFFLYISIIERFLLPKILKYCVFLRMDLWITQLWITMSKPSIVMKNLMCASIVQQDMPPPCPYLHIVQECTEWIKQVIFDHLINYQIICEFDILFWHTVKFRYSEKGTNLKKIFHL